MDAIHTDAAQAYEIKSKKGRLIGVSVGPGDPELLTIKAFKAIQSSPVIAVPKTSGGNTIALDIIDGLTDMSGKTLIYLSFLMSTDKSVLKAAHLQNAALVREYLDKGLDVAMLNIGDASLYGTFSYINDIIKSYGYETVTIPGVTSFCAVAARLNTSLTETKEPLHIIPGYSANLDEMLSLKGSKVLMKSGSVVDEVKRQLNQKGLKASLVANCGMPNEKVYEDINDASSDDGYFVTILVK